MSKRNWLGGIGGVLLLILALTVPVFPQTVVGGMAGGGAASLGTILGLWSGTCPSGTTAVLGATGVLQCISPFPGSHLRGSILAVAPGSPASASVQYVPFTNIFSPVTACGGVASANVYAPIGGYLRNYAVHLSAANTQRVLHVGGSPSCDHGNGFVIPRGGLFVSPFATQGGYFDSWSSNQTNWQRVNQYEPLSLGFVSFGTTTTAVVSAITAEWLSDDGTADTWLGFQSNSTIGVSSNNFLGIGLQQNTTEINTQLAIPIAGTVKNLIFHNATSPTNNVVLTVRKNGVDQAVTATITGGDTVGVYRDFTNTATFAQGDLLSINAATGAATTTAISGLQLLFVPGDSTSAVIWGSFNIGTVSTTNTFAQPFSAGTGTTETAREIVSPIACTARNLYAVQATANGGSTVTTLTLRKNEADTALTGTIGVGVTGAVAVDTTHTVSIAQGDRLSLKYVTNTGTSGNMATWSMACGA